MRKSENYKGEFATRLKEARRYLDDLELSLENDGPDRFWRTADSYTGYLRSATDKLRETAREGALLAETERYYGEGDL